MTLLDAPQTVEMLRFIQDRGGKVSIDEFNAAFPNSRRWVRDLIREKCVAAVDLRAVQLEDASGIQPTAYALLPMGEAVLAAQEQQRDQEAREHAEKEQERAQAAIDKRESRCHDYLVTAFGAVIGALLTLLIEHFGELIALIKELIFRALFP